MRRSDLLFLGAFALAKLAIHAVTAAGYGYFRDELYYLACADHLAWGYVDHPPLSIFLLWLWRGVFGDSLFALRMPAALAGAATVFLAGMITREIGGGRKAQALACMATLVAPVFLVAGSFYSMNPLDQLFWALGIYVLARLITRDEPRLWLVFGVVAGLGLLNKISMLFFGFAVVAAMLLTPHRKHLRSPYLWAGGAIALLIFLPHLAWQVVNGWPTLEFTRNAALYKNAPQGPLSFFLSQILLMNPATLPLWLGGLGYGLFAAGGRPFRWLALVFLAVFLLLSLTYGKDYYLAPAFPLLLALGGVWAERSVLRTRLRAGAYMALLVAGGLLLLPFGVPVLPIDQFLRYQAAIGIEPPRQEVGHTGAIPQHFADRFGWEEMAAFIAEAYHELPEADRARAAILVNNYGEAAAIDFFGPAHGLPRAISGHNNYHLWGPHSAAVDPVLAYHHQREALEDWFEEVTELGRFEHPHAMPYQNDIALFLCRGLKAPLAEAWPRVKQFI